MHNVADVEVQKNIMDANKRLANRNKDGIRKEYEIEIKKILKKKTFSVLILLELLVPVKLH